MKKILLIIFLSICARNSCAHSVKEIYPFPKSAWDKTRVYLIGSTTPIVIADSQSNAEKIALNTLLTAIKKATGYQVSTTLSKDYIGTGGIIFGIPNNFDYLSQKISVTSPLGESLLLPAGYILDVSASEMIIAGADEEGLFNAITTCKQLWDVSSGVILINGAHVWDYPDYPDRWVFSGHNLLVVQQLSALETIADTMSLYKLNGIQQNDFKYSILQNMGANYFQNTDGLKSHIQNEGIELIPGVIGLGWSSGILYNDPNLAEGLPATATYIIEGDTGRLIPDPRTMLINGGFETINANNQFSGWGFYDGPNVSTFQDKTVFHGGTASARCTNFTQGNSSGNCRFSTLVNCDTNKYYSMSAWIKTQSLSGGFVQMLALGGTSGQTLTFTQLSIPATGDWQRVEVNFNTLSNTSIRLYIGIWGGVSGTIWFDDFSIQEAGLSSVLRRAGCPLTVTNNNSGIAYTEGTDFEKIIDPLVDSHKDSYFPYHTPPTFKRIPGHALHNGDTIKISYYHPFASVSDNTGNGSVMACVSEDTLVSILKDQVTRVNNLYHPSRFFMGHDEIRNMNHDKICLDRKKSPADLLSENMTQCHNLIRNISPKSEVLMWSDMVDSLHNSGNNYYLINGDLRGDWDKIPKDITIVNWNGGNAKSSLQFFQNHGFNQISSPYYDVGNTSSIRAWRIAQEGIAGVKGMMYTTWNNDYNFLRAFSYYAWGAGPNIIHTPLDTSILNSVSFQIYADVRRDPYDNTDAITSVEMDIVDSLGTLLNSYTMTNSGGSTYSASIPNFYSKGLRYTITATNTQGLTRTLPTYIIMRGGKLPNAPILLSVADSTKDTLMKQTLKWKSIDSPKSYHLQISNSTSFTSPVLDSLILTDSAVVYLPTQKQPYHWRVQALNETGASNWSVVWQFSILCVPPIPTQLLPLDSALINSDTVLFSWTTTSCDEGYDIQIAYDKSFANISSDLKNLLGSSYPATKLNRGLNYYWHIKASSSPLGSTPWSPTRKYFVTPAMDAKQSHSTSLNLTNHPNPLRDETQIDFRVAHDGFVSLKLVDLLGRETRNLIATTLSSGEHSIMLDAKHIPAGLYILDLRTSEGNITKQIQILR
ncbi:MAG: glycoside hydrolase family 20 zincin-like fold domain-containing protein [bacterium]